MLPRINNIKTKIGDYLLFATTDYISRNLYNSGEWDPHLLEVSRMIYRGVDQPLILDIGANLGAFSVPVGLDVLSCGGQVHSFEPQRIVYYQLCGNLVLNRLDNVFTYNVAVGAEDGEIDIPVLDYEKSDNIGAFTLDPNIRHARKSLDAINGDKETVAMICLNNINLSTSPTLIKIDVEGMEQAILNGGENFLARHQYPTILLEIWGYPWFHEQRKEIINLLEHLGYELINIRAHDYIAQHPMNPLSVKLKKNGSGTLQFQ